jgi:arylformamidase
MLIDISPALDETSPVFPGDAPFRARRTFTLSDECPVNVAKFEATTHIGAHADAPLHYKAGAAPIDAVALDAYVGPCTVIHALGGSRAVAVDEVVARLGERKLLPRFLIRTYARAPALWDPDFRGIAPELIDWLADRGVVLIGVDTPSLDPAASKTMEAHQRILAADMRVLEGLVLDTAPEGEYELIALPLKLKGLDAAPVRAVLRGLR